MNLPPEVQTLVDQMRQAMGWQAWPVQSIEIHLDRDGLAQDVKPTLSYRRAKVLDGAKKSAHA